MNKLAIIIPAIILIIIALFVFTKKKHIRFIKIDTTLHCISCGFHKLCKTYKYCPKCGEIIISRQSITETEHLLSSPKNAERINQALKQYKQHKPVREGWEEAANKLDDNEIREW